MTIKIQIADKAYQQMVAGGKRLRGTIGLVNPKEGNFNAWATDTGKKDDVVYKLTHGRVRINSVRTLVSMRFDTKEECIDVPKAIQMEAQKASEFTHDWDLIEFI